MTIAGSMFKDVNGGGGEGGGMRIAGAQSKVILELCHFTSCSSSGRGGAVFIDAKQLDLYGVSFEGNTAPQTESGRQTDDTLVAWGTTTVHNTCPEGWSGSPSTGSGLVWGVNSCCGGALSGTPNSYTAG